MTAKKEIGVVIPVIEDRVLIMRRTNKGREKWDFPGGKIEKGETPRTGALRELREEAGITARPQELKHVKTYGEDGKKKIHLFRLDLRKANVRCRDGEHDRYCWVTLCQIGHYPLSKGAQESLYEHGALDELLGVAK
jgi:8-oxo-dGTP diphosphatase